VTAAVDAYYFESSINIFGNKFNAYEEKVKYFHAIRIVVVSRDVLWIS
jgi:hypothetical protein